jgi:uncharacterized membrane-anchored protein YhcB (DUF1043 family)
MTDERFEELMRDAARNYNRPAAEMPLDAMWAAIESQRQKDQRAADDRLDLRPFLSQPRKRPFLERTWVRMAAMLVLGLGVGRLTARLGQSSAAPAATETTHAETPAALRPYQSVTVHYLGETAALLVALPTELREQQTDAAFLTRADELLLRTRLLLDSPAATDPSLRALFEDLEVILAQVVRLQSDRDPTRIDLLQQSLEQRDVMPRLRNAVVDHIAD